MSTPAKPLIQTEIYYPESDGQPMADNTLQFEWIVTIKEGLDVMLPDDFVGGNILWYPIEGSPFLKVAPDVLVALGRPKGDRSSYKQWEEGHIAPQVVFEVLSPGNTFEEMQDKQGFYEEHGVSEYYIYSPHRNTLWGWRRMENRLEPIAGMSGWVSPRLGIRFERTPETLHIFKPNGERFLTFAQLEAERQRERAEKEHERAEKEALQVKLAEQEQELERLKQKLKDHGLTVE
ncbi:MAG: Uma2 family endonuclease [Acidobacteria bacterium]|nr:Uma2 family endonuclease [Acidobacteriota bacterium]